MHRLDIEPVFLKQAGVEFDAAYSSPLVRAVQTAEIVLPLANKSAPVKLEITGTLLNESRNFSAWLKGLSEYKHVLLVGHAPSMCDWVCQLLGLEDQEAFKLPKGGLACLKTDDRATYSLKFFVSPKVLGEE